ncbi:zinc ribbon domain-containing protein [Lachnospira multipara]|uniref:zinc ribbon domain-containing protein n=1 Tax=Lachnospira multipara TaxID=28051 RepID=UPI00048927D7|nr:zinc ribbon domain-containing protein [Lachnospira multipara]
MYCPKCGAILSDDSVACNKCGMSFYWNQRGYQSYGNSGLNQPYGNNMLPQKNDYYSQQEKKKPGFLIDLITALCLIITVLTPIGIFLMWKYKIPKSNAFRTFATVLFTCIFIFWIRSAISGELGTLVKEELGVETQVSQDQNSNKNSSKNVDAKISETEVYNANDVKIVVKSIENNKVTFYIENNSSKDYSMAMHSYAINGYMADNNMFDMSSSVAKNSKATVTFTIPKTLESGYKVNAIKKMDFIIWFYDKAINYKDFDTGILTIKTNLYDAESEYNKNEQKLLEENSVTYSLSKKDEGSLVIEIKNNSNQSYSFSGENIVVNGFTLDTTFNLDVYNKVVYPGCYYQMTIKYNWDKNKNFKKENGISKINTVTMNFEIIPDDDYYNSFTSSQLSINY